jgi:hypothetical protein
VPLGDTVSRYSQRYLRGCDGKYTCSWEIHLVVVAEPETDFREKRRPNRVKKVIKLSCTPNYFGVNAGLYRKSILHVAMAHDEKLLERQGLRFFLAKVILLALKYMGLLSSRPNDL